MLQVTQSIKTAYKIVQLLLTNELLMSECMGQVLLTFFELVYLESTHG